MRRGQKERGEFCSKDLHTSSGAGWPILASPCRAASMPCHAASRTSHHKAPRSVKILATTFGSSNGLTRCRMWKRADRGSNCLLFLRTDDWWSSTGFLFVVFVVFRHRQNDWRGGAPKLAPGGVPKRPLVARMDMF